MITIFLALIDAFKTNPGFDPWGLYILTFIIDVIYINGTSFKSKK